MQNPDLSVPLGRPLTKNQRAKTPLEKSNQTKKKKAKIKRKAEYEQEELINRKKMKKPR